MPAGRARCPSCPCSTRTSPPGSGGTWRASAWSRSWPGGVASSPACPRGSI